MPFEAAKNPQKKKTVIIATKGELPDLAMKLILSKVEFLKI